MKKIVAKLNTFIASVNPPPEVAMLNTALNLGNLPVLMPPPPIPAPRHKFAAEHQSSPSIYPQLPPGGPSVHVPSAWQNIPQPANPRASGHAMTLPPGLTGYSAQHVHYAAQHERWA